MKKTAICLGLVIGMAACARSDATKPEAEHAGTAAPTLDLPVPGLGAVDRKVATPVALGAAAPDFELPDLDGKKVKLSDYRGKVVVLEWFNPECPFVKQSHEEGSLKTMAERSVADGVVWLAIDSNALGKQGSDVETIRAGIQRFGMKHPVLLDPEGKVGRMYGATRTPHMYVIDAAGVLVYRGAIDDTSGGDVDQGQKVTNFVADAITDVKASQPVRTADTKAWGCTVKYAE
jgi:peroxiredoxin